MVEKSKSETMFTGFQVKTTVSFQDTQKGREGFLLTFKLVKLTPENEKELLEKAVCVVVRNRKKFVVVEK